MCTHYHPFFHPIDLCAHPDIDELAAYEVYHTCMLDVDGGTVDGCDWSENVII